jgi:hypothetical protein
MDWDISYFGQTNPTEADRKFGRTKPGVAGGQFWQNEPDGAEPKLAKRTGV